MQHLLEPLTEPVALGWCLLLLYIAWRLRRREFRRIVLPSSLAVLVAMIGSSSIPARLVAGLERSYAGTDFNHLPTTDVVVMLGGTSRRSVNDAFGADLNDAVDRVVTAVQVVRLTKAQALVLGGGGPGPGEAGESEGELNRRWLEAWGVVPAAILTLGNCRNTHDEAEHFRELRAQRGWKRVILVTSAAHLRRSIALFRKLGVEVTPVGCDFRGLVELADSSHRSPFPGLRGFDMLGVFLHEEIGWWVYRLRGWVD